MKGELKKLYNGITGFIISIIILLGAIYLLVIPKYKYMSDGVFIKRTLLLIGLISLMVWRIKRARRIYFDSNNIYFKSCISNTDKEIITFADVESFENTGINSDTFFYYMFKYRVNGEYRWKMFIPYYLNEFLFKQLVDAANIGEHD